MSEFKVGDKVRRIRIDNGQTGAKVGQVGVVVSVEDHWALPLVFVGFEGCDERSEGAGEGWFPQFAELVTDELPARFKFTHDNDNPSIEYTAQVVGDKVKLQWVGRGASKSDTYTAEYAKAAIREGEWKVVTEPTTAEALQAATDALAVAVRAAKDADAVEIELFDSYHAAKDRACNLRAARNAAENAHRQALAKHYGIA